MKDALKKSITKVAGISEEVLSEFVSYWEIISYHKGHLVSLPNRTDKYLYFTVSGIQKAYYLGDKKLYIVSFTQPNHFTCAPESFLTQKPSKYFFECITPSQFYRISYPNFNAQIKKHNELQAFLVLSLMGLVHNITERFIHQTSLTIEERYKSFMKNDAQLINQIPHKDIANYLNINATNFSKLINKVIID